MRSWSVLVGRLFGVEVRVHLTFFLLPLFVYWMEYQAHVPSTGARDMILAGIVLASVGAHEAAHMLAARRFGLVPKAVILLPLSGVTLFDESKVEKRPAKDLFSQEVYLALVGPMVSLALAAIAAGVVFTFVPGDTLLKWPLLQGSNLPRSIVWANIFVAGLNLLPAYPLDGGRILRAYFAQKVDFAAATRRAVSISHAIAMVLMVAGLFSDSWLTLIGVIVFSAAQLEERAIVFQSVLDNVRLEEVMLTDFATLSSADTLEDALEKAVHSLQDDFPVLRGNDLVGVISKQRILETLRAEGNGYVQAVMNKIFEVSARQESLGSAFRKLNARDSSMISIVEDQRLVGIVTLQNLMHSMSLLAESRKLRRENSES